MMADPIPATAGCNCHPRPLPAALEQQAQPDPWMFHDERDDVLVFLRADLGTRWGETVWRNGVPEIHLAVDLGRIQRRCTLAHELIHAVRGAPCRSQCPEDEEATVEATARWLLPDIEVLAAHLAEFDLPEAAERLNVTRTLLTERIDRMTDDEIQELGRLMRAASAEPDCSADPCVVEWPAAALARRPVGV